MRRDVRQSEDRRGASLNSRGYFIRAARAVFADGTIWWRAVALSALNMVPILGAFVVGGYMMVLMRDAAWGVERGLPRFSEHREILRRGLSAFVISLVWSLPLIAVFMVVAIGQVIVTLPQMIEGGATSPLPWWFSLTISIPTALLSIFIYAAWVRAAVYLSTSAGLSLSGVRQLIGMNRKAFIQVAWLPVAASLLGTALALPASLLAQSTTIPAYVTLGASLLSGFVIGLVTVPLSLIVGYSYGIWANETDPASWPPQIS